MLRIGLTGGIGAGKSEVAGRLAEHGAIIIDADRLARAVVAPGTDGLREVVAAFGPGVRDAGGGLDRAALAAAVFDDPAARRRLEDIIHPRVRAATAGQTAAAPADAVVVNDVPLLVETGLAPTYHLVLVVEADERVRLDRLLRDRELTEQQARARIRAQADDAARRAAGEVLITNNGSLAQLHAVVDQLWVDRLVPYEANLRHRRPAPRPSQPVIVDPDPDWPGHAERLLARLRRAAGADAVRIDHVGSTAVPGLAAKDVIDAQVVVADLAAAEQVAGKLDQAGLARFPGEWYDTGRAGERHPKVVGGNADPGRPVNVHLRPANSPAWRDALLLRDWLRQEPASAAEYAAVKRELAAQPYESIDAYASAKTPWIASALARADRWAARTGWQPPPPDGVNRRSAPEPGPE